MNFKSLNIKWIIGSIYLLLIIIVVILILRNYSISDFLSYEFIKSNRNIILNYKNENFLALTILFFIFSVFWVLLLGFAMPLLLFSGFVFGKWWGIIFVLTSTTIGATLLYILASLYFREIIKKKFTERFSKMQKFFDKNGTLYFMFFRFIGGGGVPYAIQNVLPVIFNMSNKNYIIATFLGSMPSMFVTVSIGSGIETIIDNNVQLNFLNILTSPEIYIPIVCFFILLSVGFIIKKKYFKE